jgi:hypothetical protein
VRNDPNYFRDSTVEGKKKSKVKLEKREDEKRRKRKRKEINPKSFSCYRSREDRKILPKFPPGRG